MTDSKHIERVYFLGIGGIGMSALARYFHAVGKTVSGYDKTESSLTQQLVAEGIDVHYADDIALLDAKADIVVLTPAIPQDHAELNWYRANHFTLYKRSQVLGMITASTYSIAVAGTHGKTTTTTMIAHILRDSGFGCNAFLGGIAGNYDTNFWAHEKPVSVAEADEYDRSFLQLQPDIAVISSMDPDHLDIYGTAEVMEAAFIDFSKRIKPGGLLISKHGLKRKSELVADRHITYSFDNPHADAFASRVRAENGSYVFDVVVNEQQINDLALHMGGLHNIENVVAAITVAKQLEIDDEKIKTAVAGFKGVKRRFEYVVKNDRQVFIDDYAHHPEELRALISSTKNLFPDKKCTVVFQPHLYSRTNDLAAGFADSLDLADEVLLLPIYPARELPMPGVSSDLIRDHMANKAARVVTKAELVQYIRQHVDTMEVLVFSGAGDIDLLIDEVKQYFNQ